MKINTIIVDDEPDARETLKLTIENYCSSNIILSGTATSIKEAVKLINISNPELILLDIDLAGESGFELFDFYKEDYPFKVIFTTGYKDYAIKAFKYAALDYILKPVDPNDLNNAIKRFIKEKQNNQQLKIKTFISNYENDLEINKKIVLPKPKGYDVIKISEIAYCKSEINYTRLITVKNTEHLLSVNIKKIEELLPDSVFFRIHKSYLINLNSVISIDKKKSMVTLKNNMQLPVAGRRISNFIEILNC